MQPQDSTIAVVGDGFGSLMVFSSAVYLGFRPEHLAIYGTHENPIATYQRFAYNLGQTVLRSESESHFLPADWPTFAQLDAWSRRSLSPLFRSIKRRYNPGVPEMLTEVVTVQQQLGWNKRRVGSRVGWLQREYDPSPHFALYDEEARFLGRARHVMLAPGHGPLVFPPALAKAREDPALADRIVQAYEQKTYASEGHYVVIGAGIASVNEWVNALDVGAKVVSLLRQPMPDEQDLNTPRCLFEALGLDAFQALPLDRRIAFLGQILKGTTPRRRSWQAVVTRARREGRFEELIGEIDQVEAGLAGLRIRVSSRNGLNPTWLDVTGVVAGTGFNKSPLGTPILRRLIQHYDLPFEEGRLELRTNCGIPKLDMAESRLCLMGLPASTVVAHGDTIAGLKYIARRFVADCARAERIKRRGFASRVALQLSLASATSKAIHRVRRSEQLA